MQQPQAARSGVSQEPALKAYAQELAEYLKTLSIDELKKTMNLSDGMAEKTQRLIQSWSPDNPTLPAIDAFLGDIYSGLQVQSFTDEDRGYANTSLFILSGLYGVLRALDQIQPYRLEMGYKLPGNDDVSSRLDVKSLYNYWGDKIARQLPVDRDIINLSAVEYTKVVFPYLKDATIITPKFLTVSPKNGEPTFVTVHTKIARGAFARWLIQHKVRDLEMLKEFNEIGYEYDPELSTNAEPVFVAKTFNGIGLSIRLTGKA